MRHWVCKIKEVGNPKVLTPEILGDENTDEDYCIKFWGLKESDIEWYELKEVNDE